MKRKIVNGLVIMMLATMLAGCAQKETPQIEETQAVEETDKSDEQPVSENETVTEAVEEQQEVEDDTLTIPDNFAGQVSLSNEMFEFFATEDWQIAYKKILDEKTNKSPYDEAIYSVEYYCLDDIDKDSVPEFMYFYGTCEADYQLDIYTFNGKEAIFVDTIPAGHSMLYTYPNENGLIQYYAHMGYASAFLYTMKDGKLASQDKAVFEEDINEKLMEDWDADYTPLSDIFPGAQGISYMDLPYSYGLLEYGGIKKIDWGISDSEFQDMVDDIILNDKEFYAVAAENYYYMDDNFYNGTRTIEDLYEDPLVVGGTEGERVVKDLYYGDFNNDGQTEALAVLEESENLNRAFLVLSYQNGNMYGYVTRTMYNTDYEVTDNNIYEILSYGNYKDEFTFCLDQCKKTSYVVTGVDFSEEAKESLKMYRQDLRGGDDGELGVMFLGYSGTYSMVSMSEIISTTKMKYSDEAFLGELNRCRVITQPGEEVYLLIPASENFTLSIYEQLWGADTEDEMPKRGKLLYQAKQGEVVIVRGNQSDIVSNIEVVLRANGRDLVYHPSLSLENGRVQTQSSVIDVTRYND